MQLMLKLIIKVLIIIYNMEEMKTQKINNSKILKRNKSKDVSDKKTKKKS